MKVLIMILTGIGIAFALPAVAHAGGGVSPHQCMFQGDWNCQGPVQWNGPLLPTWDVPPYGGNRGPMMCDPNGRSCEREVPQWGGW
ncbi:MAG TPA: hypothetical protein VF299_00755 [Mycobacterium sp.]